MPINEKLDILVDFQFKKERKYLTLRIFYRRRMVRQKKLDINVEKFLRKVDLYLTACFKIVKKRID